MPTADDRAFWRHFRLHSRTFSFATRLLPPEVQQPVATVYAYCRHVDSVADERPGVVGRAAARAELDGLRRALDATLAGTPPDAPLWKRLHEATRQFGLRAAPLYELLDGAAWDLDGRPVRDARDLVAYSNLVAGSVGAMVLPLLVDDRAGVDRLETGARALGVAMQITNILRDVGEDRRDLGRCYVPENYLACFGFSPETLACGPRYAALCEDLMTLAEARYDEAFAAIDGLPARVQTGVRVAARLYREILNEVRAAGYDNLSRRAVVPLSRKLRLVLHDGYVGRREALRRVPAVPALA